MADRKQCFRVAVRKFGPFESAIEKQWHAFEAKAQTGLRFEAQAFDLQPLHEALFESGGLQKGDWDVAFVSTDWIAIAAECGALADLSPYLASSPPEGFPGAWSASLLGAQDVNGKIIGLPYHDGPECLIYRKDIFGDHAKLPATWEDFYETARNLSNPRENLYGAIFAAFPDGHNTVYDFCLQLWSRGGELFNTDGLVNIDTSAGAEALRYYRTILRDHQAVHPHCRDFDSVRSGFAFARGEAAMMVNWFGFAAMCQTWPDSKVKDKISVARVPRGTTGRHVSLNSYWVLGISPGCPNPELAWEFIRHCASPPMDKLLTLEGGIGCRTSTWKDPDVSAVIQFYPQLEELHKDARTLPRLVNWTELSVLLDEMMLAALHTDKPEHELLSRAEAKMNDWITHNGPA